MPPVHWRLYGWARGEPFYQDRPASYWSAEIATCKATAYSGCGMTVTGEPFRPPWMFLTRQPSLLDRARWWVSIRLNRPDLAPDNCSPLEDHSDPTALPVLIALLAEPNPQVRYFAAQCIIGLGEAGRPALPNLQALASDKAEVFPGTSITVAHTVAYTIYMLESDGWRKRDSIDTR